jgi:MYXO-CTERM domain-containing protein
VLQSSIDGGASWQNVGAFGDGAPNWYTDNTINGSPGGSSEGWTGRNSSNNGSNGWVTAIHNLDALSGQADVLLRIAFGSDSSINDDGFGFDDFQVFDNNTPEVTVANASVSVPFGGVAAGSTDVAVQSLVFGALGAGPQDITALTITKVGNIMDIYVTAKLYGDDGDGAFNPMVDTLIDTQMVAAGIATFNTTGMLSVPSLGSAQVFVAYDIDINAMAGDTFGSSVAMATTDVVAAATVTAVDPPFIGPTFTVAGLVDMLPFTDDMSMTAPNLSGLVAGGVFPTATAAGATIGSSITYTNDALIEVFMSSPDTALLPVDGTSFLAISMPNGAATGAVDYAFELSAFSAAADILWLEYRFADTGEESDDEDNIFISLDGGATWAASLRRFDWTDPVDTWIVETVDVSAALTAAALEYTNNVRIRFQAQDDSALGLDGLLLDRVTFGRAPEASVERIAMMPIADEGSDMVGTIGAAPQSFMYTISNSGDFPLSVDDLSFAFANDMNVSNVVITPMGNSVPAGGTLAFQVDFEPAAGAFSFDLSFTTVDPHIADNIYNYAVNGTATELIAEIDVQRPAGSSIASGMSDSQGDVNMGEPQTLTYTIENVGFGVDLNVSGVAIMNGSAATATVTSQPDTVVGPGATTTFDVEYTADAEGAWNFDVVVSSDDADEGSYTITVDGTATDPDPGTGGGGMGGSGTGGSPTGGSSAGGSDGGASAGGGTSDDGGCGCSTPGQGNNRHGAALALWMLGLALVRRRKGRR